MTSLDRASGDATDGGTRATSSRIPRLPTTRCCCGALEAYVGRRAPVSRAAPLAAGEAEQLRALGYLPPEGGEAER